MEGRNSNIEISLDDDYNDISLQDDKDKLKYYLKYILELNFQNLIKSAKKNSNHGTICKIYNGYDLFDSWLYFILGCRNRGKKIYRYDTNSELNAYFDESFPDIILDICKHINNKNNHDLLIYQCKKKKNYYKIIAQWI